MAFRNIRLLAGAALVAGVCSLVPAPIVMAQDVAAVPDAATTPEEETAVGLSPDELNVLVARIALYPDDLIALISSAALYPLQVVEAERYLETVKTKSDEKPKDSWDGSVISLLNYPQVVKMMSDDLEWTQSLGTALAYQQADVLTAIQQLRDEAVANNVIKSDDKMKVTNEGDNVVIQSASTDTIYIPEYPPEMFYEPDYDMVPIGYYPDPYPYYYSPAAPYFAGFVTGAIWGAAVDWDHGGVWGGNWGSDVEVNCNQCFNNINGKVRASDVDWRNVDRSKVSFDHDQFTGAKRDNIRAGLEKDASNNVRTKASGIKRNDAKTATAAAKARDVRTSAQGKTAGLSGRPGEGKAGLGKPGDGKAAIGKPGDGKRTALANQGSKTSLSKPLAGKAKAATAGKPKPAAKLDNRPKQPSALGEVRSGKTAKVQSSKGRQAMAGHSQGSRTAVSRGGGGGGGHSVSRGGGGGGHVGGHGGGGGGGRGGGGRHR